MGLREEEEEEEEEEEKKNKGTVTIKRIPPPSVGRSVLGRPSVSGAPAGSAGSILRLSM
jgi:hypothetical protein